MGQKPSDQRSDHDLFRTELTNLIDQRHELVKLAALIDWQAFADKWSPQFVSTTRRPALPTRLMAALLYLKHVYALSDEDVVERWCVGASVSAKKVLNGCWRTASMRPRARV